MDSGLYVTLSGQMALMRRLDTLAHNVANATTAGFRAEKIKFDELLARTGPERTSFVNGGSTYISREGGELVQTENALDVAINGNAWLGIQTPAGTVYTRDGRMTMTPDGQLLTLTGYPVLDVGGAPIQLNPGGGQPSISRDGTITQGGAQLGALGLFTIPESANLSRFETSGVIPSQPAEPALDFSRVSVVQGFIERANVNPVMEMSRMIMIQRAFDAVSGSLTKSESSLEAAIKTLGEPS